jgi:hypothetical protein
MLFQQMMGALGGGQYCWRVGRTVMRFPNDVRVLGRLMKLLYRLKYGSMRVHSLG